MSRIPEIGINVGALAVLSYLSYAFVMKVVIWLFQSVRSAIRKAINSWDDRVISVDGQLTEYQDSSMLHSLPERTLSSDTSFSTLEEDDQEDWWTATVRKLQDDDASLTELDLDSSVYIRQQGRSANSDNDSDVALLEDDVQALAEALAENTSLLSLTLRNLRVTSPAHLVTIFQAVPHLQTLQVEDTRGVGLETVARLIASLHSRLTTFRVPNQLSSSSTLPLLASLQELRLNHAPISLNVAKTLSQGLQALTSLERLDFQGSRLDDHAMVHLCGRNAMATHPSVKYWCLDFNSFGNLGMQAIGSMLQRNRTLQELHLFGNSITPVGAQYLAQALVRNFHLKSLVLSLNDMGDRGVAALALALTHNATLEKLWMPSNNVGNAGVEAVAHHMPHWQGLRELNLGDSFDNSAAQAILKAMPHNYTLRKLYLESPVYDCEQTEEHIDFHLRLNQCGRQQWLTHQGLPPNLWAHALAKTSAYASVRQSPDVLCYLLQQMPSIVEQPFHNRTATGTDEEDA